MEPEIQIVEENLVPQPSNRVHHNIQVHIQLTYVYLLQFVCTVAFVFMYALAYVLMYALAYVLCTLLRMC